MAATKEPEQYRDFHDIRNSADPIDRLTNYINALSPHNLWKARSAILDHQHAVVLDAQIKAYDKGKEDTLKDQQAVVDKAESAYGGCHNCYGKAYATYRSADSGYGTDGDIGGYEGRYYRPYEEIRYCTCDRGKQFRDIICWQERQLLERLLSQREKALNGQPARSISVKKIEAELQRLHESRP